LDWSPAHSGHQRAIRLEDFTEQVQTNFFGVVHVSKAAVPILREHVLDRENLEPIFASDVSLLAPVKE
jgi:hypothetical protein